MTTKFPLPPVPGNSVLMELDAHGMTPESAPDTWQFLGRVFMYYDVVKAMQ